MESGVQLKPGKYITQILLFLLVEGWICSLEVKLFYFFPIIPGEVVNLTQGKY